jgi:hypothetical protein
LSDTLLAAFPKTEPVPRPEVVDQVIQDPNWVAGFTSAEGCFIVAVTKSTASKSGVRLRFQVTQHSRDIELMISFIEYLDCGGSFNVTADKKAGNFIVTRFSDIIEKIIPFFDKYPVEGVKALDYADFKRVAELMRVKAHLTADGLEEIRQIKAVMNTGRSKL